MGLPASTTNQFRSKLICSGTGLDADDLHAERAQVAAECARLAGQRGGEPLAELNGVERRGLRPPPGAVSATRATIARASGSIVAGGQAPWGISSSERTAAARASGPCP